MPHEYFHLIKFKSFIQNFKNFLFQLAKFHITKGIFPIISKFYTFIHLHNQECLPQYGCVTCTDVMCDSVNDSVYFWYICAYCQNAMYTCPFVFVL